LSVLESYHVAYGDKVELRPYPNDDSEIDMKKSYHDRGTIFVEPVYRAFLFSSWVFFPLCWLR